MPDATAAQQRVAHCLMLDALAAEVVSALRKAGVDAMLLKGPATVRWLYPGDAAVRRYDDVDLLVAPDQFHAAGDVLCGLGFRARVSGHGVVDERTHHVQVWTRGPIGQVDLHRGFHHVADRPAFWQTMHTTSQPLTLGGVAVPAPDRAGTALVTVLHTAANGTARRHAAKSTEDLRRALNVFDADTWATAAERAAAVGADGAFAAGLQLLPSGRLVAGSLDLRARPTTLAMLTAHGPDHYGDRTFAEFLAAPWRTRIRMLRNLVAPRREVLRQTAAPSVTGLGAAYVRRLAHVLAHVPGAWSHWRTARRASSPEPPPRRTARRVARLVLRVSTGRLGPDQLRVAWWTTRAVRRARRQLAEHPPDAVVLPAVPPTRRPGADLEGTVRATARVLGASCLESATARQRWLATTGVPRDLVIGVTAPTSGFRAHAWLDGDRGTTGFTELTRVRVSGPRLPDFVVIGAPKSGTTSLFAYLRAHPEIFMPREKEPEFFNDDAHWRRGVGWYRSLFADAAPTQVVGEASVRYATLHPASADVPERMAQVLPDARIVYVVRHPVHRMVSQWQHNRTIFAEQRGLEDALRSSSYLASSRYADRLAPFLVHYPADRVHVVVSERLRHHREDELRRLFAFLGVDPDATVADIEREHNRAVDKSVPRPWLAGLMRSRTLRRVRGRLIRHAPRQLVAAASRLTRTAATPVAADPRLVAELEPLFADDVARLRTHVDGPFDGWGIG